MAANPKLYALLVGVNEYSSAAVRNLKYAVEDVTAVRDWLCERSGLTADRCILLASPSAKSADVPTRGRFLEALDQFIDAPMDENDTFVLYFAGHGSAVSDEAFLLAADSNPRSSRTLEDTAVSFARLKHYIGKLPAGQQVLIFDACRNEPTALGRGGASEGVSDAMARNIGVLANAPQDSKGGGRMRRAILSACWQGQVSYEYPDGSHSWFCHNLVQCLRERVEPRVDLADLSERIEVRMRETAWRYLPDAKDQSPHLILEGGKVWLGGAGSAIPVAEEEEARRRAEQERLAAEEREAAEALQREAERKKAEEEDSRRAERERIAVVDWKAAYARRQEEEQKKAEEEARRQAEQERFAAEERAAAEARQQRRGQQTAPLEPKSWGRPKDFAVLGVAAVLGAALLVGAYLLRDTQSSLVKVNPKDGQRYVWIPPGIFQMGCSEGDAECTNDEKPAHTVIISNGFWIGQTEATQGAYQKAVGRNPSYFKGEDLPVEMVSWYGAESFCEAVGMRLPTEAEWEYAARAGSQDPQYGRLSDIAWYADNSGGKTQPVRRKQPNGFGLYDMLGNVWEWVEDLYGPYGGAEQRDPRRPPPGNGVYHAARGGSFDVDSRYVRVSDRWGGFPGDSFGNFGVRCAGELP